MFLLVINVFLICSDYTIILTVPNILTRMEIANIICKTKYQITDFPSERTTDRAVVDESESFLNCSLDFCIVVDVDGEHMWFRDEIFRIRMLTCQLEQEVVNKPFC